MPDGHFSIDIDRHDPTRPMVHLFGELDLAARDDLTTALIDPIELDKPESITVDLDQVPFIDSDAIGGILDAYAAAIVADVRLRLRNAHGIVHRVFSLMGLLPLFDETAPGAQLTPSPCNGLCCADCGTPSGAAGETATRRGGNRVTVTALYVDVAAAATRKRHWPFPYRSG